MQEYTMFRLKEVYHPLYQQYPYFIQYYKDVSEATNCFYELQCAELFDNLDDVNPLIENTFKGRSDYRKNGNLHCLKNELTKEICIIIVNRYQINIKCDKISNVLIHTLLKHNSNYVLVDKKNNQSI